MAPGRSLESTPAFALAADRTGAERRLLRVAFASALAAHALLLSVPITWEGATAMPIPELRPPIRLVNVRLAPPPPPVTPIERPLEPIAPRPTIPVPEILLTDPLPDPMPIPLPDAVEIAETPVFVLDAPPPPAPALPVEPTPATAGPIQVGGAVVPPREIEAPRPVYPEIARRLGKEGLVILQLVVDREGRVGEIEVLRGAPFGMSEAALDAVRSWRFAPATLHGEAVAVYYQLTVRFTQVR